MITEWGQGCHFDTDVNDETSECNAIMGLADRHLMGWIEWYFQGELWSNGRRPTDNAISLFSRTYARRIAGRPVNMHYDPATKNFKLCFIPTLFVGEAAITEIYANFKLAYPRGVDVVVTDNLVVTAVDSTKNVITVRNKVSVPGSPECITVTHVDSA